ncbi:High affinity Ca2+/Mn2+ P-type ATPase-like protein [Coemansia interrupta]|uniref:Calcium-transporting ATPase n=1 Tax=Coemansia interrupta TaxID=1126814 RepID=A0A9W8HHT0_9FUNG|nr:High affinity Ca2+/Mn2+ P-type ATPase-like protein [Coemansia interrupta]
MSVIREIERREHLTAHEFVRDFLEPNVPVVLGRSFTSVWPALRDWVTPSNTPDFSFLLSLYAPATVQVADCDTAYFSDQKRTEMRFSEFIHRWRTTPLAKLYCKDWHFTRDNAYRAYEPPAVLSNDWVNLYCDLQGDGDDFRFCYLGGRGTWTPFHEDVWRSYSWSANVCGRKLWTLVPPGQNALFTDALGNWVHDLRAYDAERFPRLKELHTIEVVQEAGETMFVPSGWWHQVVNLEDTVSINHNWGNEFNLAYMCDRLQEDMGRVRWALRDVADMDGFDEYAQGVLKADSGTDYRGFAAFVDAMVDVYREKGGPETADAYFRTEESVRGAMIKIDAVLARLLDDPESRRISGLCESISAVYPPAPPSAPKTDMPRGPLKSTSEFAQDEAADVLDYLATSATSGIASTSVRQRQQAYGMNVLAQAAEEHLAIKFVKSIVTNSMVMLLLGSAGVSVLVGNWDDAFSITLAILIVSLVGFVQEYRSEKSLEALSSLVPNFCHVVRDGEASKMLADHLVPGDVVRFATGDRIPADVRIVEASHLEVDESALTGESEALAKTAERVAPAMGPQPELTFAERRNIGFMGTLVRNGHGRGVVVRTGAQTEFGHIHAMLQDIETPRTPLQRDMDVLGQQLSLVSFGAIGLIFLLGVVQGKSWLEMFTIGVSLAVAAIPEGLPIVVTVTLALGVFRMARRKAICRKLPSVETLGAVNVVCADKTGTLTMNRMEVEYLYSLADGLVDVRAGAVEAVEQTRSFLQLLRVGNVCNNASVDARGTAIGQATDIAILNCAMRIRHFDERERVERLAEVPFSSESKFMQVEVAADGDAASNTIYIKGALEVVLDRCSHVMAAQGALEPLDEARRAAVGMHADQLSLRGLRVVAAAFSGSAGHMVFAGLFFMHDPPRPHVDRTVSLLLGAGVRTLMITGDSETTAVSVARSIGIPVLGDHRGCLLGPQLDRLDDREVAEHIRQVSVFARMTPRHKVRIVRALQGAGDVVAMTGDGVNDAPALRLADIGISMGEGATDVAKEAADLVLVNDDLSTILAAIEEGKGIFGNVRNFVTFQLSTSVAALTLVALATLLGLPQPLNAMQVLWINILMDGPPAQSLGVEPVDPEVMKLPPRSKDANIITRRLVTRVLVAAALIVTGTMAVYVSEMQDGEVTARDTSMTFTTFVCFDMFNALACRSATRSVFDFGLFTNTAFNFAVAGSLVGQLGVIYLPFLQRVFQTEALGLFDVLKILVLSSSVLWVDEAFKWWEARKSQEATTEDIQMQSV